MSEPGFSYVVHSPVVKHCPFCGFGPILFSNKVPFCPSCRAAFFVRFSRYIRLSQMIDAKKAG